MSELSWVPMHEFSMVLRLLAAAVLGGIVGMERGSGDRPAGFRTHILVCVGSALFMLVSMYGFGDINDIQRFEPGHYAGQSWDASRIASQVVSGIGFLGAGTILHEGLTIKGLTTAASLWMVSAIGLTVGSGMYFVSFAATAITMLTLVTFHSWEKRFAGASRNERGFVRIETDNRPGAITFVTEYMSASGAEIKSLNVRHDKAENRLILELYLKLSKNTDAAQLMKGLLKVEGVISVRHTL